MVFECGGGGEVHEACCGSLLHVTKMSISIHRNMYAFCSCGVTGNWGKLWTCMVVFINGKLVRDVFGAQTCFVCQDMAVPLSFVVQCANAVLFHSEE